MILKYYMDEKGSKVYTLKSNYNNKPTVEAHYKFIKFKEPQQSLNSDKK